MTQEHEAAVTVRGLSKVFGAGPTRVEALSGIDLVVRRGEFVAIMGPSGSGKSTLLHLLGGLDQPTSGTVQVGGQRLQGMSDDEVTCLRRRSIGLVFQAFNLLPVLTARENVALPLVVDGVSELEAERRAAACLESLGLAERENHYPTQLSGGEQQRVAIARALCPRPQVLLADEPTGNLDSASADQIVALLRSLVDDSNQTVLMVTHNPVHAAMADRLIKLRDGHIEDQHTLPRPPVGAVLAELEGLP